MPAPKDAAKERAAKIREVAAKKLPEKLAERLQELANEGKLPRNKKTGAPMQTPAAERLGMDQPELSEIIRGIRTPGADKLAVMCEVLGISADEMLGLKLSDEDRAARLVRDLFHPAMKRLVFELLKTEYEGAPKELTSAAEEVIPRQLPQETESASEQKRPGRKTTDTVAVRPTKRTRHRKSAG